MHGHSACFGSCSKSPDVLSAAEQPSKFPDSPVRRVKEFWGSSSNEGELTKESKSSQRSLSFSKQDQSAGSYEAKLSPSRVDGNHGLALWMEQRREWTKKTSQAVATQTHEPVISWSSTYEDLLSTSRPFAKPIPLPEMVNFLVGVWEQEGFYD
ncbi:hypothetical protein GOP47_0024472 [Adiantum capillus-veneris]|uniref:Gag1-like clamp domain-containing protein n=1 Tax=Adiantum capillus-veneris TaxID=13818 RepID=A0A9D4Z4E7_ADICA|nr:hypothetical protein GOP47_0024472 [Adiantum capillus-veneris]